ncbi:MAG: hypothetical protein U1D26_00485 [Patescibacteria group bacterium]|nr:hypothetical protein [Patescibacteria group bacterium]
MKIDNKKEASFRPLLPYAVLVITALIWAGSLAISPQTASSASDTPITGYGWSDTIGWVSFNCADLGTCGSVSYGMSIATNGDISGYAWSEAIGWVQAYESPSGCPQAPCAAKLTGGSMRGWFKALAGGSLVSGGWDGWISLSGSGYGPSIISGGGFDSYAWGSDVVGWIDFSQVRTDFAPCNPSYSCTDPQHIQYTSPLCQTSAYATCTSPAFCVEGSAVCLYPPPVFIQSGGGLTGHLQATPQITPAGLPVIVTWNVDNVSDCTVSGDNGDGWSGTSGSHSSSPILQQTIYTLNCAPLDGSTLNESVIVNVLPIFQEI